MITNLFNKFDFKNNIFQSDNKDIKLIKKETDVEKENNQEEKQKLISSYEGNEIKNVLIKAFNFEPNINGYETLLKERKNEIKKGIEYLKTLSEVKVVSKKGDKFTKETLKDYCDVIEVSKNDIVNDAKINKIAFSSEKVKVYDLFDMNLLGQALLEVELKNVITVYGSGIDVKGLISYGGNLTYKELFNLLNGKSEKLFKVINGGIFTGKPIYDFNANIDINTKALLFLTEEDCNYKKEIFCINCSKCVRICPENLNPIKIVNHFKLKEEKEVYKLGINNCIECGLCSYICPSNIEILQKIKVAKSTLNRGK